MTAPPGWTAAFSGKVRDVYTATSDPDVLLLVATDRVSAFDHVLRPGIDGKGVVLTAMSRWWFARLASVCPNHLLTGAALAAAPGVPGALAERSMVARRLEMVEVECVARGYLAGSAWAEYRASGTVAGHRLPAGLVLGSRLPEPMFTPATKAPSGEHDENITTAELASLVGAGTTAELERLTLAAYGVGHEVAAGAGLVLADTKFEFGRDPRTGELVLADEVLTPDSSRYWAADTWRPGRPMPQYDKQIVRDWLAGADSGWSPDSAAEPPPLPPAVVEATAARYRQVLERLTG